MHRFGLGNRTERQVDLTCDLRYAQEKILSYLLVWWWSWFQSTSSRAPAQAYEATNKSVKSVFNKSRLQILCFRNPPNSLFLRDTPADVLQALKLCSCEQKDFTGLYFHRLERCSDRSSTRGRRTILWTFFQSWVAPSSFLSHPEKLTEFVVSLSLAWCLSLKAGVHLKRSWPYFRLQL